MVHVLAAKCIIVMDGCHVDHKKIVAMVPTCISMHTCGSVSIIMVLCLVTLWAQAAGAPQ